ncbi:uncharacterized protein LOC131007157 [Salvia miltiorrhiza]|uniref:uncharacterized protein LOC131007157 n=1 Tax=Salvia miltiorrhiza TaxID=226208 RepID=UPI0025ABCA80|nr:uncharacterized protein LOC131007157 [Salvia miltiorrhiza]
MVKKNLSTKERNNIVQFLLANSKNGKPLKGKMKEVVFKFNSSERTVCRLLVAAKNQQSQGEIIYLQSQKPNTPRRKRVEIDLELILNLDLLQRSTIRKLAFRISCSKSTMWRWVNKGLIKAHTSAIKSDLTAPNKLLRFTFILEALEFDRIINTLKFKSMNNTMHIDEKWFYITKTYHRLYLRPGEAEPHRTCRSRKSITKVMFMCAMCRPIFFTGCESHI